MKKSRKIFMAMLLISVMLFTSAFAPGAYAEGPFLITPFAVLPPATLQQIKTSLQTQYNNSTANSSISAHMGYLSALKAIDYAIAGTSYSQMDCSKLTYTALKEAYTTKGLSSYYIFGSASKTAAQQYTICVNNGLTISSSARQTGDLIFWKSAAGAIHHVGIYLNYNGSHYVIESRSSVGGVVVTDNVWSSADYIIVGYARVNTALTATFKTGTPFNENLGTQKVLYNCPPTPPPPPTYSGYVFARWTPSVTTGMTANTTYTANYVMPAFAAKTNAN